MRAIVERALAGPEVRIGESVAVRVHTGIDTVVDTVVVHVPVGADVEEHREARSVASGDNKVLATVRVQVEHLELRRCADERQEGGADRAQPASW